MFITKSGKKVRSIKEIQEGRNYGDFLKENVGIWKTTMSALGYYFIENEDSLLPVWLKNPIPEKYINKKLSYYNSIDEYDYEFNSWICNNFLVKDEQIGFYPDKKTWAPNFIIEQAHALEQRLLDWGKYNSKDTDYDIGQKGYRSMKYSGSEIYKDIYKVGMSEPDIITRAFIELIDNKEKLRRKF